MRTLLSSKATRTGVWYLVFCAALLAFARSELFALCTNYRFAVMRELIRHESDADVLFLGSSRTVRGVVPEAFSRWSEEFSGERLEGRNLAVLGETAHVSVLVLEAWLDRHDAPEAVFMEVGESGLTDWPHEALARFMGPGEIPALLAQRPYDFRTAVLRDPFEELGPIERALHELDRTGHHLEIAVEVLGRGPEDLVRAGFNLACNAWGTLTAGEAPPEEDGAGTSGTPTRAAEADWEHPSWLQDENGGLGNPYWSPNKTRMSPRAIRFQISQRGWQAVSRDAKDVQERRERLVRNAERLYIGQSRDPRRQAVGTEHGYRITRIMMRRLSDLCRSRGIRLVFVHMPGFTEGTLTDNEVDFYSSLGDLYQPDLRIIVRLNHYQDVGHLNDVGALMYTRFLAKYYCDLAAAD